MTDKLIVLAGGASSRMKKSLINKGSISHKESKQANQRSKGLISLNASGRPLMDYLLFHAQLAGYKTIYLITGKDNALFKSFYGKKDNNNKFKGLTINYAVQLIPDGREKPFGTADALYQAYTQYPELKTTSFTVCNSDNLYSIKALELLRTHHKSPNAILSYDREALEYPEDRIARFAVMQLDIKKGLVNIIEKPTFNEIDRFKDSEGKSRVSMNIFKFDGSLFYDFIKNCPINPERNEKEIPTALLNMVTMYPGSVIAIAISEHVPDLTSKEDIAVLKIYVEKINIESWS